MSPRPDDPDQARSRLVIAVAATGGIALGLAVALVIVLAGGDDGGGGGPAAAATELQTLTGPGTETATRPEDPTATGTPMPTATTEGPTGGTPAGGGASHSRPAEAGLAYARDELGAVDPGDVTVTRSTVDPSYALATMFVERPRFSGVAVWVRESGGGWKAIAGALGEPRAPAGLGIPCDLAYAFSEPAC